MSFICCLEIIRAKKEKGKMIKGFFCKPTALNQNKRWRTGLPEYLRGNRLVCGFSPTHFIKKSPDMGAYLTWLGIPIESGNRRHLPAEGRVNSPGGGQAPLRRVKIFSTRFCQIYKDLQPYLYV